MKHGEQEQLFQRLDCFITNQIVNSNRMNDESSYYHRYYLLVYQVYFVLTTTTRNVDLQEIFTEIWMFVVAVKMIIIVCFWAVSNVLQHNKFSSKMFLNFRIWIHKKWWLMKHIFSIVPTSFRFRFDWLLQDDWWMGFSGWKANLRKFSATID